ncbi:MAG TPA: hypothetical protein VM261_24030 [Kofleriaceae bacterium]|nr:hypothetical protein [Kofleriaceae bacterium]
MRARLVSTLLAVSAAAACSGKKKEPAAGSATASGGGTASASGSAATQEPRVAPPSKPLPGLAEAPQGGTGKVTWVTSFGGVKVDTARRLVAGPDGSVFVVGDFDEAATFGTLGEKTAVGKSDAFVAKVDGNGVFQWVTTIGGKNEERGDSVAVDAKGNVAFVGLYSDVATAGGLSGTSDGSDDMFVVATDAKGEVQWLWDTGGLASDAATSVSAAGDGGWIVAASFGQKVKFGETELQSKGLEDAALVKLSSEGEVKWVAHLGGEYPDEITHLDVDPSGNIYALGHFKGTLDIGGTSLKSAGDDDLFVAKFDSVGNPVWSARLGNAFAERPGGLSVDGAGNMVIAGSFDKDVDFFGTPVLSKGESDVFVARLGPDGKLLWVKTYGGERADAAYGVDTDAAGNVVVAGGFETSIDLGGGVYKTAGYMDGFFLKLDPNGAHVWSRRWGAKDQDVAIAVTTLADGSVFATGAYRYQLDLVGAGPTAVQAEGSKLMKPDAFIARLER